jgi:3-dehydroquinate dehydratase-2
MHGVNLDQLGGRDPLHYGTLSLTELEQQIARWAQERDLVAAFFQSNHEGEFVEHLHGLSEQADGVIVNAGAWTHYSYAIRDALEAAGLPAVEVHLSDISAREEWRKRSVFDGLVLDVVSGQGPEGYRRALEVLSEALSA